MNKPTVTQGPPPALLLGRAIREFYGIGAYVEQSLGVQIVRCLCGHCIGYKARLGAEIHLDQHGHVSVTVPSELQDTEPPTPFAPAGVTDPAPPATANHGEEHP